MHLSHLIDHELDLRVLDERFKNHDSGAPAYAPAVLLKVILYAYSRGMIRSRDIAQACQENVTFMVLSGESIAHFTTLAACVRDLRDEIADLFTQVLFLCDAQGLIGREIFGGHRREKGRCAPRRPRRACGQAPLTRRRNLGHWI